MKQVRTIQIRPKTTISEYTKTESIEPLLFPAPLAKVVPMETELQNFSPENLENLQKDYSFLCQHLDPFKASHPEAVIELLNKYHFTEKDPYKLTRELLMALDSIEMEMRTRIH